MSLLQKLNQCCGKVKKLGVRTGVIASFCAVALSACSQPKPSDVELRGLINSYLERNVRHTLHAYQIVNTFSKQIDNENRTVFDFIAFAIGEGKNPFQENGSLELVGFRGAISCVKRGNQWYAHPFAAPERLEDSYKPTEEEMRILGPARSELAILVQERHTLGTKQDAIFSARTEASGEKAEALYKQERAFQDEYQRKFARISQIRNDVYHQLFDSDFSTTGQK